MIEFILSLIVTVLFSIFVVGAGILGAVLDIDDYKDAATASVYFHALILGLVVLSCILDVATEFLSGDMQPFTTVYNKIFSQGVRQ